jgi:hypothetical protein
MPNLPGGGGNQSAGDVMGKGLVSGVVSALPVVGPAINAASGANSLYKAITGGKIPGFADGGIVPGIGPRLAVVHGGETITPAGAGQPIVINIQGSLLSTAADVERAVIAALQSSRLRGALPV